jgi:type VI protein secretion system component Hcp
MKTKMNLALLATLLITGLAQAAVDAHLYIKFDGVDGEVQDAKHEKWIELQSYQHTTSASPTGTGGEVVVTKLVDKASPGLFEAFRRGRVFATVLIHVVEPTVERAYELKDVIISSYSRGIDRPMEQISLTYKSITVQQQPTAPAGGAGPTAD